MAYLNRATLIGNIGKDPEIKTLQNGRKFVSFSLATSKRYRDNNGEQKEETQWHNIVIWGKTAETFENIGIVKGTQLYIEGELVNRSWTDNQGSKRSITEVSATSFQILTPRGQGASSGASYGSAGGSQASGNRSPYAPGAGTQQASDEDMDLPF